MYPGLIPFPEYGPGIVYTEGRGRGDLPRFGFDYDDMRKRITDEYRMREALKFLDEKKKMETWTKEEWANSYKGSIITSDGSEVITDQEINTKVGDLEQKLQANTAAILNRFASLLSARLNAYGWGWLNRTAAREHSGRSNLVPRRCRDHNLIHIEPEGQYSLHEAIMELLNKNKSLNQMPA